MEKHTCKLCFRRFSNGRALGGHMRSHVTAPKPQLSPASSASTSAALEEHATVAEDGIPAYVLRENPKKSIKFADRVALQDWESDAESPRGRRSDRRRRRGDPSPASSVSDANPEEDVAISLMMLSRDSWKRRNSEIELWSKPNSETEEDEEEEEEEEGNRKQSKYQCGVCKRVFRSHQALGGHRASHKKSKGGCFPSQIHGSEFSETNADLCRKTHECPFCFRLFGSAQALGGHKRSHLSSSSNTITTTPPPPSPVPTKYSGDGFTSIDLNLPAPLEEEFELSAISDAEFVASR
ncbi:zinc finger protein ZAT1-like [Typha angustifolia]|uniref:zinc finger protein ZAT1-like n=1 Tax=Typha angustifolia TaxID=59011 RepID=UPI003C2DC3FB